MSTTPDQPLDPSLYIDRLSDQDAFHREAAAWSLGEIGSERAARPLAGLLLRELESVEALGCISNDSVVRATIEAIRRIGANESLYALVKSLVVLAKSKGVDEETVGEIVDCLAEVGGYNAVREAGDRVVQQAKTCAQCGKGCPGLQIVSGVLMERMVFCGDAAVATLRRLSRSGPQPLQRIASGVLMQL